MGLHPAKAALSLHVAVTLVTAAPVTTAPVTAAPVTTAPVTAAPDAVAPDTNHAEFLQAAQQPS